MDLSTSIGQKSPTEPLSEGNSFTERRILDSDGALLADLAHRVWGTPRDLRYWEWKYRGNRGRDNGHIVVDHGGVARSAAGYWHRDLLIDGKPLPWVLMLDMMTDPGYRGKSYWKIVSYGRTMARQVLLSGFTNDNSRNLYSRILQRHNSLRIDTTVPKWILPLDLEGTGIPGPARRVSAAAFRGLISVRCRTQAFAGSYRIELLRSADPCLDDLWDRTRASYPVIGNRDRSYLSWRYFESPQPFRFWTLWKGGDLRGYLVTCVDKRGGRNRGLIIDWLVDRNAPGDFRMLVKHGVRDLVASRVSRIETWMLDNFKPWTSALRSLLFWRKWSGRYFMIYAPDHLADWNRGDLQQAFVTMGDADYPGPGSDTVSGDTHAAEYTLAS